MTRLSPHLVAVVLLVAGAKGQGRISEQEFMRQHIKLLEGQQSIGVKVDDMAARLAELEKAQATYASDMASVKLKLDAAQAAAAWLCGILAAFVAAFLVHAVTVRKRLVQQDSDFSFKLDTIIRAQQGGQMATGECDGR